MALLFIPDLVGNGIAAALDDLSIVKVHVHAECTSRSPLTVVTVTHRVDQRFARYRDVGISTATTRFPDHSSSPNPSCLETLFDGDKPTWRLFRICKFLDVRSDNFLTFREAVEAITQVLDGLETTQCKAIERQA